jgi:hypothetical protein
MTAACLGDLFDGAVALDEREGYYYARPAPVGGRMA